MEGERRRLSVLTASIPTASIERVPNGGNANIIALQLSSINLTGVSEPKGPGLMCSGCGHRMDCFVPVVSSSPEGTTLSQPRVERREGNERRATLDEEDD